MKDNQEVEICVEEIHLWGIRVAIVGEADAFLDNTKTPNWCASGEVPEVGERLHAVVLDATRSPVRVSALPEDIAIARSLRKQGSD